MTEAALGNQKADPQDATYSIRRRLTWHLSGGVMVLIALMALSVYLAAAATLESRHEQYLRGKMNVVAQIVVESFGRGGLPQVSADAGALAHRRPQTRAELRDGSGRLLFTDRNEEPYLMGLSPRSLEREIDLRPAGGGVLRLRMQGDTTRDRALLRSLSMLLLVLPLAGGALAAAFTWWRVGRDLTPLIALAAQTQAITADRLDQRLELREVSVELRPWVTQFNALMSRLQHGVVQLESFNGDVAHELRTPLFAVMGHIEVTLSRPRTAQEMKDVLADSLEQLQGLTAMVQDMLFLARSSQPGTPLRTRSVSLRSVVDDILEFYRLGLDEAGLGVAVNGDSEVDIDVALVQRALSNLIDNAIRHAQPGTAVTIAIEPIENRQVRVVVANMGIDIDDASLPRIFDRFFRADPSRHDSGQHHGLGLAIVAAIARAHGGAPWASSSGGVTRVGFELAVHAT